MLRATIEMVPFGDEDRKRVISVIEIANISLREKICDYACRWIRGDKIASIGYVKKFNRQKGAEKLLELAIKELLNGNKRTSVD